MEPYVTELPQDVAVLHVLSVCRLRWPT